MWCAAYVASSVAQDVGIRWAYDAPYDVPKEVIVVASDALKAATCGAALLWWHGAVRWEWNGWMALAAVLWCATRLLTFVIEARLDVGLYTMLYQHRVLTTVALARVVTSRRYARAQWAALATLLVGLVTLAWDDAAKASGRVEAAVVLLVLAQGACSATASVAFEWSVRRAANGDLRRAFLEDALQLYVWGALVGSAWGVLGASASTTGAAPAPPVVVAGLACNGALAGLCAGVVMTYHGAVAQSFAQCLVMVGVVLVSATLLRERLTLGECVGAVLVVVGATWFGAGSITKPKPASYSSSDAAEGAASDRSVLLGTGDGGGLVPSAVGGAAASCDAAA